MDSIEDDLYSMLNVSHVATHKEIKDKYHALVLVTHPDKLAGVGAPGQQDGSSVVSDEYYFNKIQMAYRYLSNEHTRLIYDNYGVPGLIMFEKFKEHFQEPIEKLRELDGRPEILKDTAFEY